MTWGWRDIGWVALIGAATLVANGTPLDNAADTGAPAWIFSALQFGVPAVLAVRLADAAVDARRVPAWLAYAAAVATTVLLGVWVIAPALNAVFGQPTWWTSFNDFRLASTTAVWHGLGMAVYVQVRSSQQAQARLLVLQGGALAHQRALAGARLAALQARVEPELLFERLQHIHAELRDDPPTARARLIALIELLRAVQPHTQWQAQAAASSLAREVDALRAYTLLMSPDGRDAQRLQLSGRDSANAWDESPAWPIAPLVLLPLVRPLLADGHTRWRLSLHGNGENKELRLQALGPDAASTRAASGRPPVDLLNERLRAVHGASASLTRHLGTAQQLPSFSLCWPVPAAAATATDTRP
jgi:Histidine kinase